MLTAAKIGAAVIVSIVFYLYWSSPERIVVEQTGDIKGLVNEAREYLQGERFWENQLTEVSEDLTWELEAPKREAEHEREMREMDRELDRDMEQFYRENPDLRPSAAERRAEALREQADRVEEAEWDRKEERWRLERIEELKRLRSIIQARLNAGT